MTVEGFVAGLGVGGGVKCDYSLAICVPTRVMLRDPWEGERPFILYDHDNKMYVCVFACVCVCMCVCVCVCVCVHCMDKL